MTEGKTGSDIFDIRLTKEGAESLMTFAKRVKWIMLSTILIAATFLIHAFLRNANVNVAIYKSRPLLFLEFKLHYYYIIIYCFIFLLDVYYYWKTGITLKRAIENKNEVGFNNSFHYLVKSASFYLVASILVFIFNIFELVITLKYYYH